jgi:glucose/arabinose dehydrogenase
VSESSIVSPGFAKFFYSAINVAHFCPQKIVIQTGTVVWFFNRYRANYIVMKTLFKMVDGSERSLYLAFVLLLIYACSGPDSKGQKTAAQQKIVSERSDSLPEPYATKSARNFSKVLGWPDDKKPVVPNGFTVTKFAGDLENPRWMYVLPNGDVLVAESATVVKGVKKLGAKIVGQFGESANRITLLRDANKDGIPELRTVFLEGLNQPFGMLVLKDKFYVANTDGLYVYAYKKGATRIEGAGQKIVSLPAGGYNNHWTRNIISNKAGTKIYITVGSGSNNAEHGMENEIRRANILEINPDGSGERVYAGGLRNPVGIDWAPGTQTLWAVVNERDNLGDDLVPDYLTSVKENGFYGWPYAYFGRHPDPRMKDDAHMELVQKTITPDVSLGSHTASLGLAFYNKTAFPERYRNGAFIGQHGSWNRSELVGYKVVFVPFKNGRPSGKPEDFLTGFIADASKSEVYGRPVGITVLPDGSLLVADDAGNTIWRVQAKK